MDLCETRGDRYRNNRIKHCGANYWDDRVINWMMHNDGALEAIFVLSCIALGAFMMLALAVGLGAFR